MVEWLGISFSPVFLVPISLWSSLALALMLHSHCQSITFGLGYTVLRKAYGGGSNPVS